MIPTERIGEQYDPVFVVMQEGACEAGVPMCSFAGPGGDALALDFIRRMEATDAQLYDGWRPRRWMERMVQWRQAPRVVVVTDHLTDRYGKPYERKRVAIGEVP